MLLTKAIKPNRFIITGIGRCGSNMIFFALKEHPRCRVEGELFNRWMFPEVVTFEGSTKADQWYAKGDTGQWIAVGFKIFRHQATNELNQSVWSYLAEQKVRVIHLIRRNLFETILSEYIARKTKIWHTMDVKVPDVKINRPPEWWNDQLKQAATNEQQLRNVFQDNPYIRIYYEDDIVPHWNQTMDTIQRFIGLSSISMRQLTKKQAITPPWTQVTNYPALKEYFEKTEWRHFFN